MADLSDFKRGQIVGTRMASASAIKIGELFSVARSIVSREMTAFEKEGKTWKTLEKSERLGTMDFYTVVWRDHKKIQLRKLQQTISRTQFP